MRRIATVAALLVANAIAAGPAFAALTSQCCACVFSQKVVEPPPTQPALFCGQVPALDFLDFAEQCDRAGGNDTPCTNPVPGQTCNQTLLTESAIACPAPAPAPAATASGLGALALALGGLGVLAMRRRAR